MVSSEAAQRFLQAPFLADVDGDARQTLLGVLHEGRAKAGTVILKQDELNDQVYFLIEGTVAILRTYPEGNTEHVLDLVAPTGFGETSFFQKKPQVVTIKARTNLWYLTLERQDYENLRRVDPRTSEQLAIAAIRVLAEHFDLIDQRMADFFGQSDGSPKQEKATEWARFRARLFGESRF